MQQQGEEPHDCWKQGGDHSLLSGNLGPGHLSRERQEQLQPKTQSGRWGNRYSDTFCGLNILSELRYFHTQFQHCAGLYIQSNGTQLYLSNTDRLCVNSSLWSWLPSESRLEHGSACQSPAAHAQRTPQASGSVFSSLGSRGPL